jgi:hypothetical protein
VGFKRQVEPILLTGQPLTEAMVGIGMMFAAPAAPMPSIEDTLVAASIEGMDHEDLRVLSLLTQWLGAHLPRVNVDRLIRALELSKASPRVQIYWGAIARWHQADPRLRKLGRWREGETPLPLAGESTEFMVRRRGEDPRFIGGPLQVPAGTLRERASDVMTPEKLAERHRGYYWRVIIGPSYRADMWALHEQNPSLKPAELARRAYGSFATAWQVCRDRALACA